MHESMGFCREVSAKNFGTRAALCSYQMPVRNGNGESAGCSQTTGDAAVQTFKTPVWDPVPLI